MSTPITGSSALRGSVAAPSRFLSACTLILGLALNIGLLPGQQRQVKLLESTVEVSTKGLTIVNRAPIEYPEAARAAGAQGNVIVRVVIDAAGNVTEAKAVDPAKVIKPAPAALQQSALTSIRKWRFEPGHPVGPNDDAGDIIVSFQLPAPGSSTPLASPVEKYMRQGDELYRTGDTEKSLRWFEQGEIKYPAKKVDFLKREAEIYIRQGNPKATKEKLNEILKINPKDSEARALRASILLDQGVDAIAVINELGEVVKENPQNIVARFNLGRAYELSAKPDLAEEQYTAVLKTRPEYFAARIARAQLLKKQARYDAALEDLEEALHIIPGETTARILKSAVLTRLKRYDEARTLVKEVLAKDPKNTQALAQLKSVDEAQKSEARN